jgi:hypothetical protein
MHTLGCPLLVITFLLDWFCFRLRLFFFLLKGKTERARQRYSRSTRGISSSSGGSTTCLVVTNDVPCTLPFVPYMQQRFERPTWLVQRLSKVIFAVV